MSAATFAGVQAIVHSVTDKLKEDSIDTNFLDGVKEDLSVIKGQIQDDCSRDPQCAAFHDRLVEVVSACVTLVGDALKKIDKEYKQKIKALESKIKELQMEKEVNEYKLARGQIAYDIEKAVIRLVLDGVKSNHHITAIWAMKKAIRGKKDFVDIFQNEEQQQMAKNKWDELQKEFPLEGRHIRYIRELKDCRVGPAHPNVDAYRLEDILHKGDVSDKELYLLNFLKSAGNSTSNSC
jgi:hypothetical protein